MVFTVFIVLELQAQSPAAAKLKSGKILVAAAYEVFGDPSIAVTENITIIDKIVSRRRIELE
jgi:hypothetical protein